MADLKDGWHGFCIKVDWSELEGSEFKIKAYTVKDDQYYVLGEPVSYSKGTSKETKNTAKTTEQDSSKDSEKDLRHRFARGCSDILPKAVSLWACFPSADIAIATDAEAAAGSLIPARFPGPGIRLLRI